MTKIAILPVSTNRGSISYYAVAGDKHSKGRTAGEALDALTAQLSRDEAGMLIISNIQLSNVNVTGGAYVGGLVGYDYLGSITNSFTTGSVSVSGPGDVGGLVGYNRGSISNSYSTVSVSGGNNAAGGLAGVNGGSISNSYSTGATNGSGYDAGGLVGVNENSISNSYSTGSVNGWQRVGGLVGNNTNIIELSFAWRNISFNWTTGAISASMMSLRTLPAPTDGSWFTSPTIINVEVGGIAFSR